MLVKEVKEEVDGEEEVEMVERVEGGEVEGGEDEGEGDEGGEGGEEEVKEGRWKVNNISETKNVKEVG